MKSELKQYIKACIQEVIEEDIAIQEASINECRLLEDVEMLEEAGPARKARTRMGHQYQDGLDDPLNTPLKYRKEFKMSPNPSNTQYARQRPAGNGGNMKKAADDYGPYWPRSRGSFKKIGEGHSHDVALALAKRKSEYADSIKKQLKPWEKEHMKKSFNDEEMTNRTGQSDPNRNKKIGEAKFGSQTPESYKRPPRAGSAPSFDSHAVYKKSAEGRIEGGIRKAQGVVGKLKRKLTGESYKGPKLPTSKLPTKAPFKPKKPRIFTPPEDRITKWVSKPSTGKTRKQSVRFDESGPARRNRKSTGIQKKTSMVDPLFFTPKERLSAKKRGDLMGGVKALNHHIVRDRHSGTQQPDDNWKFKEHGSFKKLRETNYVKKPEKVSTNVRKARERIGSMPKTQKWTSNIKFKKGK